MNQPYFTSCCSSPPNDNPVIPTFRQARLLSSGSLSNVWLPTAMLPVFSSTYVFYNPHDGHCYVIDLSDGVSTTPGSVITTWSDANDPQLQQNFCYPPAQSTPTPTPTGTPSYVQARNCAGTSMNLWKALSGLSLPYNFVLGGICGLFDFTSTTSTSPGTLLTGEMVTSGCGDPACSGSSTLTYTYSTGVLSEPNSGGSANSYTSSTQSISAGLAATAIAFNGSTNNAVGAVDDLAVMIPVGTSITTTQSGSTVDVTIPANAIILGTTSGSFNGSSIQVTDGTHTATIPSSSVTFSGYTAPPILSSAGFTVYAVNQAIPLSVLHAKGMADTSGHVSFLWVLVPSNGGNITITGVTVS